LVGYPPDTVDLAKDLPSTFGADVEKRIRLILFPLAVSFVASLSSVASAKEEAEVGPKANGYPPDLYWPGREVHTSSTYYENHTLGRIRDTVLPLPG
jgi:hypothetical protein